MHKKHKKSKNPSNKKQIATLIFGIVWGAALGGLIAYFAADWIYIPFGIILGILSPLYFKKNRGQSSGSGKNTP